MAPTIGWGNLAAIEAVWWLVCWTWISLDATFRRADRLQRQVLDAARRESDEWWRVGLARDRFGLHPWTGT